MNRSLVLVPLLALAGTALPGCAAVAIPALAGSAMFGSQVVDGDGGNTESAPVAAALTAPVPAAAQPPAIAAAPASAPAQLPTPALARIAPPPPPPVAASAAVPAPLPTRPPRSAEALAPYPDPAIPLSPEHYGFARFVRYGQASAQGSQGSAELPSAILSDPVALDGRRRRCATGEQPVVLIDLDPAGGVFAPPANPPALPGLARGLALLREVGVEITWLSDLSTSQSGALRAALEKSGLDPRGQDIVSLRRDEADTKQKRRDSLAGFACIVAIAGDERADFDERFRYLRNPAAGAGLEPLIGDGWFLIAPLLGN